MPSDELSKYCQFVLVTTTLLTFSRLVLTFCNIGKSIPLEEETFSEMKNMQNLWRYLLQIHCSFFAQTRFH